MSGYMKRGVLIEPILEANTGYTLISFKTDPYNYAVGPLRSAQKFVIICLTSLGSDVLNPTFGTNIPRLIKGNIADKGAMRALIRKEVNSAINQFFNIQASDSVLLEKTEQIARITLEDIVIDSFNRIQIYISMTTALGETSTLVLPGGV